MSQKIKALFKSIAKLFKNLEPKFIEIPCPHCHWPLLDRDDFYDVDIVNETWHPEARSVCSNPNCARQFKFSSGKTWLGGQEVK